MNPDYEKKLEARIDAELKGLGDLTAPSTLAPRVMQMLEQRAERALYNQSWSAWPRGLQIASFGALALAFAAAFSAVFVFVNSGAGQGIGASVGEWFKNAETAFGILEVLKNALMLVFQHLETGVIAGCIALMALLWVSCIGLGTAFVRLGMRPVRNEH